MLLRDDTFHNRWANSVVLQRAGIGPGAAAPAGGAYVMADGKPTGLIKEPPAWQPVEKLIPSRTPARLKHAAEAAARRLNSFGITGVQDAFVTRQILSGWHAADTDGQGLPLRVVASMGVEPEAGGDGLPGRQTLAQVRSDRLRPDFVKVFLDGVPMSYTAAMLEPYAPSDAHGHDFRGAPLYALAVLTEKLTALDRQGTPVKLHAVGDGAVRLALDAIEAVRKANGMNGPATRSRTSPSSRRPTCRASPGSMSWRMCRRCCGSRTPIPRCSRRWSDTRARCTATRSAA